MHLEVVVSQNRPAGQSRFEVHEANDWQKPSELQKLPIGQPAFEVQRHPPLTGSQTWFAPHDAFETQTHRFEPSEAFLKPAGQQVSPVQTQAAKLEL